MFPVWQDSFQEEELLEDEPIGWMSPALTSARGLHPVTQPCKPGGPGQCHLGTYLPSQAVPQSRVSETRRGLGGDSSVEGTWGEDSLSKFA